MILKVIKTKKEYQAALELADKLFDRKVSKSSPEGEQLQVLLLLIKQYEDMHFPVPVPDPIDAVRAKMMEKGLKSKDLVGAISSKGYVSAILNKKKPMTLEIAKIFHQKLGIPAEVLLS